MGSRLSLRISLTRSAIGWSSPNGPTRLGPSRTWKRPSRRRSPQVRTAKTPITRLARMNDLISVTMKPSGIRSLRRSGGDRAGADVRHARGQADDAGAQAALHERGAGHRVAVVRHLDAVARRDAERLGVGVRDLDPAAALEVQRLGVVDGGAGHQLAIADDDRLWHRRGGHLSGGRSLAGGRAL